MNAVAATSFTPLLAGIEPARLSVLISGGGSNLAALLAACQDPSYRAEVVQVVADRPASGLEQAAAAGIPTAVVPLEKGQNRAVWDEQLCTVLLEQRPNLVISAGFLKILGPQVLAAFPGRILNTHNSLLPAFPGIRGPAEALDHGVKLAGATLFLVDAGLDTGQIIAQVAVPVQENDTVDTLSERIKVAERRQLVQSVGMMLTRGWTVRGRHFAFGPDTALLNASLR